MNTYKVFYNLNGRHGAAILSASGIFNAQYECIDKMSKLTGIDSRLIDIHRVNDYNTNITLWHANDEVEND